MKRFVRSDFGRDAAIAVIALFLVALVEADAATTYLIILGLLAVVIWRDRVRDLREKGDAAGRNSSQL